MGAGYANRGRVRAEQFYVTTAIAYLNGPPHVGHAYEFATTDVMARYHRRMGRKTHYLTGSDEHGQKVENIATKHNKSPQSWCDGVVKEFYRLNLELNLGPHQYVRTTDAGHIEFAQWLWRRVRDNGDIYLGRYKGWYNVKEETFVTDRDAEAHGYKCPGTGFPYEQRDEESYFFRMSAFHDRVLALIRDTSFVQPASRRNELVQRLETTPLDDLCVSRTSLKWGIPVPDDSRHVMYVWFDALSNYISALGYLLPQRGDDKTATEGDVEGGAADRSGPGDRTGVETGQPPAKATDKATGHSNHPPTRPLAKTGAEAGAQAEAEAGAEAGADAEAEVDDAPLSVPASRAPVKESMKQMWPAQCHVIGKDIIWFHCVIWPSMLLSAELPLPECVFGHGFVQDAQGSKMSKTLQNVVSPIDTLKIVSSDTFRYYLVRAGHYGTDIKFNVAAMVDMHNADLCSVVGNLVHRGIALAVKNCAGCVPEESLEDYEPWLNLPKVFDAAEEAMANYALETLALIALDICKDVNRQLTTAEPWKIKDDEPRKRAIIRATLEAVFVAAHFLEPVVPTAAGAIFNRLNTPPKFICDLSPWNNLKPGTPLRPGEVLFQPLAVDVFTTDGPPEGFPAPAAEPTQQLRGSHQKEKRV